MIYLVEDDSSIRELVSYTLNAQGFTAVSFESPSLFYKALKNDLPELVLLDIMLPEEDGLTILKKLRANKDTSAIPVIMLTAKSTEFDKVVGLDNGADDYIAKPFGMMELLSRIKALLRRTGNTKKSQAYEVGELFVDPTNHTVTAKNDDVILTLKEFELLSFLLENRPAVVSRDQILNSIWGYEFDGENRTVDVHIRTLRQKLGECGSYIKTIRGIGYKIDK
ncbi:MAG: response regulator transcription factor [Oscillospiraceae bacterium]